MKKAILALLVFFCVGGHVYGVKLEGRLFFKERLVKGLIPKKDINAFKVQIKNKKTVELDFSDTDVEFKTFKQVVGACKEKQIKKIYLKRCQEVTKEVLDYIAKMKHVTWLNLEGIHWLKDEWLAQVGKNTKITFFVLGYVGSKVSGFKEPGFSRTGAKVRVGFTRKGISHLHDGVTGLDVSGFEDFGDGNFLNKFKKLQELFAKDIAMPSTFKIPNSLAHLDLSGCSGLGELFKDALFKNNLKHLIVNDSDFAIDPKHASFNVQIEGQKKRITLNTLRMYNTQVPLATFEEFASKIVFDGLERFSYRHASEVVTRANVPRLFKSMGPFISAKELKIPYLYGKENLINLGSFSDLEVLYFDRVAKDYNFDGLQVLPETIRSLTFVVDRRSKGLIGWGKDLFRVKFWMKEPGNDSTFARFKDLTTLKVEGLTAFDQKEVDALPETLVDLEIVDCGGINFNKFHKFTNLRRLCVGGLSFEKFNNINALKNLETLIIKGKGFRSGHVDYLPKTLKELHVPEKYSLSSKVLYNTIKNLKKRDVPLIFKTHDREWRIEKKPSEKEQSVQEVMQKLKKKQEKIRALIKNKETREALEQALKRWLSEQKEGQKKQETIRKIIEDDITRGMFEQGMRMWKREQKNLE